MTSFVVEFVADVAQLAERGLGKDEVTGSIPGIGSSICECWLDGAGRVGKRGVRHGEGKI